MMIEIKHRYTGAVLYAGEGENIRQVVEAAVSSKTRLRYADLSGANLYGANLSGSNLGCAILSGANLGCAILSGANLYGANLSGSNLGCAILSCANLGCAILSGANLYGANLYGADLSGADLSGANLGCAILSGANLYWANLGGSNLGCAILSGSNLGCAILSGANLCEADLYGADLGGARNTSLPIARTRILPEGTLIGWKKCQMGVIAKLRIPEAAKRSNAFGRKCRAEYVEVLEVIGADVGLSIEQSYGGKEYRVGETVRAHKWCEDFVKECAAGIHFYITREEAEAHT